MILKPGVSLKGLTPQILLAAHVADGVYNSVGHELTITSANDSTHGAKSLHYSGNAIDLRTRDMKEELKKDVAAMIRARLGAEFDVVVESDHIHVEWDPK